MSLRPFTLALILLLLALCSCRGNKEKAEGKRASRQWGRTLVIGDETLTVEIASTPEERARGLMYRDSLGPKEGMLFVFPREEKAVFWMKNTPLPLSIAFIDERGVITEIQDMEPFDTTLHISRLPAKYALEVKQGWFRERGIGPGQKVILPWENKGGP